MVSGKAFATRMKKKLSAGLRQAASASARAKACDSEAFPDDSDGDGLVPLVAETDAIYNDIRALVARMPKAATCQRCGRMCEGHQWVGQSCAELAAARIPMAYSIRRVWTRGSIGTLHEARQRSSCKQVPGRHQFRWGVGELF